MAVGPLRRTIEMNSSFEIPQWYLGLAYEQQGELPQAIAQFQGCVRITGGRPSMMALLGHAYAAANQGSEARSVLRQLSRMSKEMYVPPYPVAAIHAALGEKDEALGLLEKAYEQHDSWMDYLAVDPRLSVLRSDARFSNLLDRMHLGKSGGQ
jgi:tetratricopeptide (TPR) repeat protein